MFHSSGDVLASMGSVIQYLLQPKANEAFAIS